MGARTFLKQIDSRIKRVEPDDHKRAVLVLHDQLNMEAWFDWVHNEKPLLIFWEGRAKGKSFPYDKKKLTYVLSSMRHFAIQCQNEGDPVFYHATHDHYNGGLERLLKGDDDLNIAYMKPSEWESREMFRELNEEYSNRLTELENTFPD